MSYKLTDDSPKIPKVSVYPVSKPQLNGKHVLLCQARDMFPDLVRFTWQAEDQSGKKVELKDVEQLEQKDEDQEVKITSMLIVDQQKVKTNKFTCSVQHNTNDKEQRVDIPIFQQQGNDQLLQYFIKSFCYQISPVYMYINASIILVLLRWSSFCPCSNLSTTP